MNHVKIFFIIPVLAASAFTASATPSKRNSICEKSLFTILEGHEGEPENVGFETRNSKGQIIGEVTAHLTADGLTLKRIYFSVDEPWQKKGLSREMVNGLLKRNPGIKNVEAVLMEDNLESFEDGRSRGLSKMQALMETPFFKVFAPHGFTLIHFTDSDSEVLVTLSKD